MSWFRIGRKDPTEPISKKRLIRHVDLELKPVEEKFDLKELEEDLHGKGLGLSPQTCFDLTNLLKEDKVYANQVALYIADAVQGNQKLFDESLNFIFAVGGETDVHHKRMIYKKVSSAVSSMLVGGLDAGVPPEDMIEKMDLVWRIRSKTNRKAEEKTDPVSHKRVKAKYHLLIFNSNLIPGLLKTDSRFLQHFVAKLRHEREGTLRFSHRALPDSKLAFEKVEGD